ncbi:MAG: cytochrome oxidase putative small subunit CydP [Methylocystis sp.]
MSLIPLNREIVIVLTFKVCAIALIYVLFFSPSHRTKVTPENMATMMLQVGPITTK